MNIDKECVALCEAINKVKGVRTVESCCGHGETPFRIWLRPDNVDDLLPVLYYIDECHCGCYEWKCKIYTNCSMDGVTYMIEGPIGQPAYYDANRIAQLINEYVEEEQ